MTDLMLNNPLVRQELLRQRLESGGPLIAADLAQEFNISLDTIRRDLLALEGEGCLQRVRGGAVPVKAPVKKPETTYRQRRSRPTTDCSRIVPATLPLIREGMTIMLDGGTTVAHLADLLPPLSGLLVVTPSPVVAALMLDKDIETHLIGGPVSPWGGVAVGSDAEKALANCAADLAFVGICALDETFGLSSHHADEAGIMRTMDRVSSRTVLMLSRDKVGQRARHHVLAPDQTTTIVTDADPAAMQPFVDAGAEIIHV